MDRKIKIFFAAVAGIFIVVFIFISILIKQYEKESPGPAATAAPQSAVTRSPVRAMSGGEPAVTDTEAPPPLPQGDPES